ncbi:MAG: HD domain-containing protein [Actinobacteria bacterium]|nr:HD domain-containing protein [Actinomycetota bacterium]
MGNDNGAGPVDRVRILIQDPHTLVRDCLRMVIEQMDGAKVVSEAASPKNAISMAHEILPDIAFIDLSDFERSIFAIRSITRSHPEIKVIALAEDSTVEMVEASMRAGATAFTLKSDSVDELYRAFQGVRLGQASVARDVAEPLLKNYLQYLRDNRKQNEAIIETLASAVEAKDRYTGGHAKRVTKLAAKIAARVDPELQDNELLRYGFILHDIGKIGVPEEILRKTSSLNEDEWSIMRTHPIMGVQIISPLDLGPPVEDIVRHHHERWDSKGYPNGLEGTDIPTGARIFSVADTFDAMTTDRPYRQGLPVDFAVTEIARMAGSQFDPVVVQGFIDLVESEPVNSSSD